MIAPQDHWHALVATAAAKAGKDMYCEKPLGCRSRRAKASGMPFAKTKRVFQTGTWQRSQGKFQQACRLVRNGYIGKIHTVEVAAPCAGYRPNYKGSMDPQPVPEGFNWEMWRGPAPTKPYNAGRVAWPDWYLIWDYCAGFITNWGVHHLDIANWGCPTLGAESFEVQCNATYRKEGFTDNIDRWDAVLTYASGLKMIFKDDKQQKCGCRFIGDKGWVHIDRAGIWAEPDSLLKVKFKPDELQLTDAKHHQDNFLSCVRSPQGSGVGRRRSTYRDLAGSHHRYCRPPEAEAEMGPQGRAIRRQRRRQQDVEAPHAQRVEPVRSGTFTAYDTSRRQCPPHSSRRDVGHCSSRRNKALTMPWCRTILWCGAMLAATAATDAVRAATPPAPAKASDVAHILSAAHGAVQPGAARRPLNVVLLADRKDHGPGEHDYPRWQSRWALLLGGSAASTEKAANLFGPDIPHRDLAKGADGVRIALGRQWPSPDQWQEADLVVAFCYLAWSESRIEQVVRYLQRGGGLVIIHSATWTKPAPSSGVASIVGVGGFQRYRHGPIELQIADREHPICVGLPPIVRWEDEPYWPPTPLATAGVRVLAVSREQGSPASGGRSAEPMFWTFERGKGRVFGCVPGHYCWTFDDPHFRILLLRGMAWAARENCYRFDDLVLRSASVAAP